MSVTLSPFPSPLISPSTSPYLTPKRKKTIESEEKRSLAIDISGKSKLSLKPKKSIVKNGKTVWKAGSSVPASTYTNSIN